MSATLLALCITLILPAQQVKRVVDGDTFILYHVGVAGEERVRVLGVDAPERGQPGFEAAKTFTATWLASGPFTFNACRRDSFGRYLAHVSRDGVLLSDALISKSLGVKR